MRILTANQIREVERKCFDAYSTEAELMLRAGTACYQSIVKKYGDSIRNSRVSVLCGNGKNAGDGFVIAGLLCSFGANAKIILCHDAPTIPEPLMYYRQAMDRGVEVLNYSADALDCDYVVDCMFGIGFHGQPRPPFDTIFSQLRDSRATVIAVDTPSGTDSTTGQVCHNCVSADYTIAISTLKYAHILPPANSYCGEVDVADIGIPRDCYDVCKVNTIEKRDILLPCRNTNDNKGSYGKMLNICGSYKMPGAAVFASLAGIRTGAGLVKVDTPRDAYPLVECHTCQPVFNPLPQNTDGTLSADAIAHIKDDIQWADSVVLGCGIGLNDDTKAVTEYVLQNSKSPIILDADGINCIIESIDILKEVKAPVVLTPHPGEMSRLMSTTVAEVQQDRIGCAKKLADKYGVVVVLKGANTVITDGEDVFVNTTGNPGMAMGGTGDMLAGMIGGLVAQGVAPFDAAKYAVYLHGLCGDIAVTELSMRGITVFDMIDRLGALMSDFE